MGFASWFSLHWTGWAAANVPGPRPHIQSPCLVGACISTAQMLRAACPASQVPMCPRAC